MKPYAVLLVFAAVFAARTWAHPDATAHRRLSQVKPETGGPDPLPPCLPADGIDCSDDATSSSQEQDTSWCWDSDGSKALDEAGQWVCEGCLDKDLQPLLDKAGAWVCPPSTVTPDSGTCYQPDGSPAVDAATGQPMCSWCFDADLQDVADKLTGVPACACDKDPASKECNILTSGPCADPASQECLQWQQDQQDSNGDSVGEGGEGSGSSNDEGSGSGDPAPCGGASDKPCPIAYGSTGRGPPLYFERPTTSVKPVLNNMDKPDNRAGPLKSAENVTCLCPTISEPVCGKNGKVYSNLCMANCSKAAPIKCKCGTEACSGACKAACKPLLARPATCVCNATVFPVCGRDGKRYGNACLAKCAQTSTKCACSSKACRADAACGKACTAASDVTPPVSLPCTCPKIWAPVCGKDGRKYASACDAKCAKTSVKCACGKCGDAACKKACKGPTPKPTSIPIAKPIQGGACSKCGKTSKPICGKNGKVYKNACLAQCGAIKTSTRFACGGLKRCSADCKRAAKAPLCKCASTGKPVCGYDGKVYPNAACLSCNSIPKRFSCARRKNCEAGCQHAATAT